MLRATLGPPNSPLTILCLGAHADDIEIGAGGTLLRLLAERPGSTVHWVVFASNPERESEARTSANELLGASSTVTIEIHAFRESYFPYIGAALKERFELLKEVIVPDLVLTHYLGDRHQDHRTIAELTWNAFRDNLIAEYEVPKYEGDLGHPNLFVPLTEEVARQKLAVLMRTFPSQTSRRWFKAETFESLMRLRGIECNAAEGFAEAFQVRKLCV